MIILRLLSLLFIFIIFPHILFCQDKIKDHLTLKANDLRIKGAVLSREGKHVEALDTFKLYLDCRKKIYGDKDYFLGSPYSSIGISYKNLGENDKALQYYQLAEQSYLLRENPSLSSLGRLYLNIGNVYRAKLDYNNALKYYNQALARFQLIESENITDIANAYYTIAEIYIKRKEFQKAINIANDIYQISDTGNKIFFNDLLGIAYQSLDKAREAKFHYQEAIKLIISNYGNYDMYLAYAYMSYAQFLSKTRDFDSAIQNLKNAYLIISPLQKDIGLELSQYYQYMGDTYRDKEINTQNINNFRTGKKNNLQEAIHWYEKGLSALGINNFEVINSIETEKCISLLVCIEMIKEIGDIYLNLANLENESKNEFYENNLLQALQYYRSTSSLIQKARKEISSDESKIQLTQLQYSTFSKIIETSYLAFNVTGQSEFLELAFNNAEQLKSSAVFDKISNDLAQENSLIPDSLLQLEKKLNNTISIYSELAFEESNYEDPDSTLLQEYNTKVFEASRQRDELNRYLEEEYSEYYALKYSNNMLGSNAIKKQLNKKDVLLEYFITEPEANQNNIANSKDSTSYLYTFFFTNKEVKFHRQKINTNNIKALESTFRFMSTPNYMFTNNEDSKTFCSASNNLYEMLIKPFESYLPNKNLIIIPDGILNYISFDGLLKSLPDTSEVINFNKLDYLVRHYNISYANSANILISNRNTKTDLSNTTLAFAPKYNSEEFELSNAKYTLPPLPGVKKEVKAISKQVKTTIFKDEHATEENFRANCSQYNILHLAMHAYINDSMPAYSRLAFSPVKDSTNLISDGWLNTADIYNLDLKAKMTVLSACNTGVGKLQKGEGMMSLARGFLYAGCPSVVMSLWEVEDQAGTEIMTSFYKNLKTGKTKDEALRLAKLDYLERSNSRLSHPHYWMSFKCIGDNSPIYTSYDIYFFVLLIVLIIAFSIDQIIRIKKARRNRQA